MIDKAGGGDFVVIRATGADGYNQYVYVMGGVDSVESLVIPSVEAANDPFVVDRVRKAEALFIAGGDESDYIEFWKGTALDDAIRDLVRRNVPIGGTSAGLAVLGQFDFAALKGTVTSADALANPYNRRMTLDREFLTAAAMTGVITDSHFDERDRMGRLLAFLARLTNPGDGWIGADAARGIGVDPSTAVAIDKGVATRLADRDAQGVDLGGSVYFLRPSIAPTVCEPRQPLTFRNRAGRAAVGRGVVPRQELDRRRRRDDALRPVSRSRRADLFAAGGRDLLMGRSLGSRPELVVQNCPAAAASVAGLDD
ncbi:cyanophycinase [Variovorax paradoxus]|nr:cyanophycinase [Variovorax paradoxus]MBT2303732.1 cyanophycinase [Variovorax paradoxus]